MLRLRRRDRGKQAVYFGVLVCTVTLLSRSLVAAGPEEPFFIYHGQQQRLLLDEQNIAVQTASAWTALSPGLQAHGFSLSDVSARPTHGWMILSAQTALANRRAKAATSLNAPAAPSKPMSIQELISSILSSGDPEIKFVSPVFRDAHGDPIIVSQRLLIGFEPTLSAAERRRLLVEVPEGATLEKTPFAQPHDESWILNTRDGFEVLARANALAQRAGVRYAEPDMMVTWHSDFFPSDPGFPDSWGLLNTGQSGGLAGFDLKATSAWDTTLGSPSVVVLVLDDGIQQNHPDINQIPGKDFTSDAPSNPTGGPVGPYDNHGTLVAGCISERISNSLGTAGIAPGVNVASARFATNVQPDGTFTAFDSWFVNALNWGQSIGARISNNSNNANVPSSAVESAYQSARANGMVHFVSAGNTSSSTLPFPANVQSVNAVGAANRFGQRSSFSNYGTGLKFLAPGEEILTTDRAGITGAVTTDYVIASGTSLASPYAAGIAALIVSQHPDVAADEIESIMANTCTDMGPAGYDTDYGYGMLNAAAAVAAVPASSSSSLIPITNSQDMVFDHSGTHLYITTSGGLVQVYNLATHFLDSPYNAGGSLYGLDIDPSDKFLLVAQGSTSGSQGTFQKIDLASGAITDINYPLSSYEAGAWDVAIASNGLAFATTQFAGSGWTPLRQIDLRTNAITIRTDAPASGSFAMVRQNTQIYRSADRTRLYFLEGNVSNGPVFTYAAPTNTFGRSTQKNTTLSNASAAVSRNGLLVATRLFSSAASLETAPDFRFVHSFDGIDSGVAFDAVADLFYGVNASAGQIICYDTNDFTEKLRINIGEQFGGPPLNTIYGHLVASQDGHYLAITTPSGIRVFSSLVPTANLANLSTRGFVQTGENVLIAGLIIRGSDTKKVMVRAIGPSLTAFGVANAIQDPTLELHSATGLIATNDNWQSAPNFADIPAGYQPSDPRESVIVATLPPGNYTAIMAGNSGTTGVGLVEVYDIDSSNNSQLMDVSTRAFVGSGDDVMIGGLIAAGGNGSARVLVRALGPSLAPFGISNYLRDPVVTVYNADGGAVGFNDNWQDGQSAQIEATGLRPASNLESAVLLTVPAGNYTAVVSGNNGGTGVALVEIYRR